MTIPVNSFPTMTHAVLIMFLAQNSDNIYKAVLL